MKQTIRTMSPVKDGFLRILEMYDVSDRTKNTFYFTWRGLCAEKYIDAYIFLVCALESLFSSETAVYSIPDGKLLAGEISFKKEKLVIAWIEIHQDDLLADWELAVNGKAPFKIKGLDQ